MDWDESSIKQKYVDELKLRNSSSETIRSYLSIVDNFLSKYSVNFTNDDVRAYLLLAIGKGQSSSYIKQKYSALKFLFSVLDKKIEFDIPNYKKESKLPEVLNRKQIGELINVIENKKHKLMVQILYSAGLRISELINLKPKNIDLERNLIYIRQGKEKKDRVSLFSEKLKPELLKYLLEFSPQNYLFESNRQKKYSKKSVEKIVEKASMKAIGRRVNPHVLRHSFATHLLEGGIDLRKIQRLLGHKNLRSTQIYTHVAKSDFSEIKSPLDFD